MQPDTTLPKRPAIQQYIASITQTGTAAPIATVIKNTIGEVTWGRTSAGIYSITPTTPFSTAQITCDVINSAADKKFWLYEAPGVNYIVFAQSGMDAPFAPVDEILYAQITINVHN